MPSSKDRHHDSNYGAIKINRHMADKYNTHSKKIRFCYYTRSRVQAELHLANLHVHFFHKAVGRVIIVARTYIQTDTHCMMKSTILCFNIVSVWVLVIKNEMS